MDVTLKKKKEKKNVDIFSVALSGHELNYFKFLISKQPVTLFHNKGLVQFTDCIIVV